MASDPRGSSPASTKSETVQPSKEDAETTAAREELRNTSISESNNDAPRSSTPDVPAVNAESRDQILSPKKKRAHDQVEKDHTVVTSSLNVCAGRALSLEPEKKRQRDELASKNGAKESEGTKVDSPIASNLTGSASVSGFSQPPSGEGNTAETLPSKPTLTFASSSLSGFAASASPFSALSGSSAGSAFGGATLKPPSTGAAVQKPTLNFSQASGASPFSALVSTSKTGFGGSFGSPFGGGSLGKLDSFAKPGESLTSDKKPRAFGAPNSDSEESGEDGDSDSKPSSEDGEGDVKDEVGRDESQAPVDEKRKLKLQKVTVDNGEAGEATIVSVRAKMYYVDNDDKDAGWKERGAGILKINVPASCIDFDGSGIPIPGTFDASGLDEDDGSGAFRGARLILRQDQTHRLLLNTVLLPAMVFQGKASLKAVNVMFTAFGPNEEGDTPRACSVNMKMSAASAREFLNEVSVVKRELMGA